MNREVGLILAAAFAVAFWVTQPAAAHPGSGIVVTAEGEVFFVDNSPPPPEGSGREIVWRIGRDGKLSSSATGGGHWLAIDTAGAFANVHFSQWFQQRSTPNFVRVTAPDFGQSLVATDGQPFVFNRDGNLYYAKGNLELVRLTPEGRSTAVLPNMTVESDKLGGIKGIACGPDGSLYLSYPRAVRKIALDGHSSMVAEAIEIEGCGQRADPSIPGPYLRGLAVAADGTVYAAASNCRAVLKITPDGKVSTLLKCDPWIPTGVAMIGENVYVLEFDDAPPDRWRPRVRRIGADGKITVLATIER